VNRSSPYKGLVPFDRNDEPFFFGRERDASLIASNLRAAHLTLLYGPTGVGKTSVLQAGVVPRLEEAGVEVVVFRDWNLLDEAGPTLKKRVAAAAGLSNLGETMADGLASAVKSLGGRVMLVLDQFEEYLLYQPRGGSLDDEIAAAIRQRGLPVSFLISIREDALAALDRFEGSIPTLFENYLRIENLSHSGAEAAITGPLERWEREGGEKIVARKSFVEAVLDDIEEASRETRRGRWTTMSADGGIETPYLQLVLERLWQAEQEKGSKRLRVSTMRDLGGARRIVRTHLDGVLDQLPVEQQEIASRLFRFLVTPSGAKNALAIRDFTVFTGVPAGPVEATLKELATQPWFLRKILPPGDDGEVRYEIAHDVLAVAVDDWRERYLERAGEHVRLLRTGTTFAELVAAKRRREQEIAEGTLSAETEARYRAQLEAFEIQEGRIVESFWGSNRGGVVLTAKPQSRLSRQVQRHPVLRVHRVSTWDRTTDRELVELVREIDGLEARAQELVGGVSQQIVMRGVFTVLARLIAAEETSGQGLRGSERRRVLESTRAEIANIHEYFEGAATRRTALVFCSGVVSGVLVVAAIAGLIAGCIWLVAPDQLHLAAVRNLLVAGLAGAFGGAVSALSRVSSKNESLAVAQFVGARLLFVLGLLRPAVGAIFGIAVLLLFQAGVLQFATIGRENSLYTVTVVGFLAGFAERFARQILAPAEPDSTRSADSHVTSRAPKS
jgi:hypothetical protein